MHDAIVWFLAFAAVLIVATAATAAFTQTGSAQVSGLFAGVVGYALIVAPAFVVQHAAQHDCGTEDGCTAWTTLLSDAIVIAIVFGIVVFVIATLGAMIGASVSAHRRS